MTKIIELDPHFPQGNVCGQFAKSGRGMILTQPFLYVDGDVRVEVPSGFPTDFNSVPRGGWNIFPPTEYPEAAVVHDFLYRNPGKLSRGQVDDIHNRIMEIEGASWKLRKVVRISLWLGGWVPWGKYRRAEEVKGYAGPKDAA